LSDLGCVVVHVQPPKPLPLLPPPLHHHQRRKRHLLPLQHPIPLDPALNSSI
jgi:hypothetical protein